MTEAEFAGAGVDDDLLHIECPFLFNDHPPIEVRLSGDIYRLGSISLYPA
jgi:hypothetical protein